MVGLPIAVDITPPDAPREHVAMLLSACSRASADAECLPASEVPVGGSRAVAIVTWVGDRRVVIEVGLRQEGRPEWRSRTLDFELRDAQIERWRTIGFIVGTLSRPDGELAKPAPSPAAPDAEAASVPTPTAPESASPASGLMEKLAPTMTPAAPREKMPARAAPRRLLPTAPSRASFDLGAALGPGLDGLRAGAMVRAGLPIGPVLRTLLAVRYLERPQGEGAFGARWLTGAAGLGAAIGSEQVELGLGLDGRVEYFQAYAEEPERHDSQARWLSGVGFGLTAAWMPTPALGFFMGADLAWMFGTTELHVGGSPTVGDSATRFGGEAGIRFRPW